MKYQIYSNETIALLEKELKCAQRKLKRATKKYHAIIKTKHIYYAPEMKCFEKFVLSLKTNVFGYYVEGSIVDDGTFTVYRKNPVPYYKQVQKAKFNVDGLKEMLETSL